MIRRSGLSWNKPVTGWMTGVNRKTIVLRTRMYATDYGDFSFARDEYRTLSNGGASACLSCDGSPCKDACTYHIPIDELCLLS